MNDESEERKRWRLRFGMRTLLMIPVLVGIYFALARPTRTQGVRDVRAYLIRNDNVLAPPVSYKAPLVLESSVHQVNFPPNGPLHVVLESSYYLWCLGPVVKLPYTSEQTRFLPRPNGSTASAAPAPDATGTVRPPPAVIAPGEVLPTHE